MVVTVDGDSGLRLVVLAGDLPDVEGLSGGVWEQAEHEQYGVGVGESVRVDLPVPHTTTRLSARCSNSCRVTTKPPILTRNVN